MQYQFELLKKGRQHVLSILNIYPNDSLRFIPKGFSNNLIWNAGHLLATQQLLLYRLSGLDCSLEESFIDSYRKGTNALDLDVSDETITFIKDNLLVFAEQAEQDYKKGVFGAYKPYETSYKIKLNTIEDAVAFNTVHENIHLGYMLAMRKYFNA